MSMQSQDESNQLGRPYPMEANGPSPSSPAFNQTSERKQDTLPSRRLNRHPDPAPHVQSDTEEYSDSGLVDDMIYPVREKEPLAQSRPLFNNSNSDPKEPASFRQSKGKEAISDAEEEETIVVDAAALEFLSEKRIATDADARNHNIPVGYSLKNWDPNDEPILLVGSVFSASTLGKWIYNWTVYRHGVDTPIAEKADELRLLLTALFGKIKRAEESMPRIRREANREVIGDFIEAGERLTGRLRVLLKACEAPMLKVGEKSGMSEQRLRKIAGVEFVDTIFGQGQQLGATEAFMTATRLWNMRFDANCEEVLQSPAS